jgi:hypothetical protein
MYRNPPKSPADGSDGSAPSEAWLFAQAILGKSLPEIVSPATRARAERAKLERLAQLSTRHEEELRSLQAQEAKARHERALLEWLAEISTEAEAKLRELQRRENDERAAWHRAERFVKSLLEDGWDPSKHPRLGGPPNAGWWVTTKGNGLNASQSAFAGTNASQPLGVAPPTQASFATDFLRNAAGAGQAKAKPGSGPGVAATPAVHTTSKGVPAQFVAAQSRGGHHWVPWAAFRDFESRMDRDAWNVFASGTKSPELYDHAFDTWSGVKHGDYSGAMRQLLDDWIKTSGGKLDENGAREFLSWIASGHCGRDAFAAKHKALFATVFKWRKGFLQSIVVAHAAAEINPRLTAAELKGIAQHVVNGAPTRPLSNAAAKAAKTVIAGGKPLLKAIAKRVLPGLAFFSVLTAAKRGWAGQSQAGDGAWGAFNETMRDLMIADVVEPIVFPTVLNTVDGLTDLLAPGLNAPGRKRYIRRDGRLVDLETGRIID